MSSATTPNFCSQCGASLSPDDAFCSQCGAAVGEATKTGAATGRATAGLSGLDAGKAGRSAGTAGSYIRPSSSANGSTAGRSRSAFQRRIENMAVEGWEVDRDYGDRVVMVDRGFGSAIVHAVLLFPTWGIGNAIYAWYNYAPGADRVELRDDGTARYVSGGEGRFETDALGYGAGTGRVAHSGEAGERDDESDDSLLGDPGSLVTSVVLGLVGLGMLTGAASATTVLVGLALLAGALLALPPVRRRLAERRSIATFGRVRTTDEEVVEAPDVPCAVCSRPVGTGVRRTFAEKLFVAGVPVAVDERGENCYCRSCAQGDPFTDDFAFGGTTGEDARGETATGKIERNL